MDHCLYTLTPHRDENFRSRAVIVGVNSAFDFFGFFLHRCTEAGSGNISFDSRDYSKSILMEAQKRTLPCFLKLSWGRFHSGFHLHSLEFILKLTAIQCSATVVNWCDAKHYETTFIQTGFVECPSFSMAVLIYFDDMLLSPHFLFHLACITLLSHTLHSLPVQ